MGKVNGLHANLRKVFKLTDNRISPNVLIHKMIYLTDSAQAKLSLKSRILDNGTYHESHMLPT
jgi:hypothetical protein